MTLDAAEHAVELGWMRDGLDLGQRALDADVTSERAYRVVMRAYTGLGETDRALRVYERCRAVLAEDLGLDPSPQTRALHLEILSSEPQDAPPVPLTGRDRELRQLLDWLFERRSTGGSGLVYVSGPQGSGRTRLVHEAAERLGARVDVVGTSDDPVAAVAAAAASARRAAGDPSGGDGGSGAGRGAILLVTAAAHLSAHGTARAARRARRRRRRRHRGAAAFRERPRGPGAGRRPTRRPRPARPARTAWPTGRTLRRRPSRSTCCP